MKHDNGFYSSVLIFLLFLRTNLWPEQPGGAGGTHPDGLESLQQLHSEGKQFAREKAFPATSVLTQALCGQKSFYLVTILNP